MTEPDRVFRTIATYDSIAEDYARKSLEFDSAAQEVQKFVNLIPGNDVIDIGCGSGRDTNKFSELGFKAAGVDLSSKLLEFAKRNFPSSTFLLADVRKIPLENETFDAAIARGVLHHLEESDIPPTLAEWYRLLKRDGVIFIMTKAGEGELKEKDQLSGTQDRDFNLLQEKELRALCEQTGFHTIESYVWNEKDIYPKGRDTKWLSYFGKK